MTKDRNGEGPHNDDSLWSRVVKDISPLRRRTKGGRHTVKRVEPIPESHPPKPEADDEKPLADEERIERSLSEPSPPRKPHTPSLILGDMQHLDRRTGDKFRKGQMDIEARLDLHGMTQMEAHAAVRQFLQGCYQEGRRCLLVITGKGRRLDHTTWGDDPGVLRQRLPGWLNDPAIRPQVLAVAQAQPRDGGGGAFYVLLKRRRG